MFHTNYLGESYKYFGDRAGAPIFVSVEHGESKLIVKECANSMHAAKAVESAFPNRRITLVMGGMETAVFAVTTVETVMCDYCQLEDGKSVPAVVDTKSKGGPWAYMCERHNTEYGCGIGSLTNKVNI